MQTTNKNPSQTWTPSYSKWRHGGWYVTNVRYPGGASGCVSNNYPDKKWRIACDFRRVAGGLGGEGDFTYKSRDEAARAEYDLAQRVAQRCRDQPALGQKYDQADYDASPEKYTRFRTAIIAETLHTWSGFEVGQVVQIEFFAAQLNVVRGNAVMPVYKATLQGADPEDFIMVYACVLQDFCL